MTWEEQFRLWIKAEDENPYDDRPARSIVVETRKSARNGGSLDTPEGWAWVTNALRDGDRLAFVHAVFHRQAAPSHIADEMLKRGIDEQDPSANRCFVEPAVKAMGARKVMQRLLHALRAGADHEKGGAASAAYWVRGDREQASYREVRAQFDDEMMRQFVASDSDFVRQRIIPMLSMDAKDYSPEVAELIPTAIQIARTHPDSYIRHRIEIQLGAGGPLQAIPSPAANASPSFVRRLLEALGRKPSTR